MDLVTWLIAGAILLLAALAALAVAPGVPPRVRKIGLAVLLGAAVLGMLAAAAWDRARRRRGADRRLDEAEEGALDRVRAVADEITARQAEADAELERRRVEARARREASAEALEDYERRLEGARAVEDPVERRRRLIELVEGAR